MIDRNGTSNGTAATDAIKALRLENQRLREHIARQDATIKLKVRSLWDYFIAQALPRAKGDTAQAIAEDAERIAKALMRQRELWEAGQSRNQLPSPENTVPVR